MAQLFNRLQTTGGRELIGAGLLVTVALGTAACHGANHTAKSVPAESTPAVTVPGIVAPTPADLSLPKQYDKAANYLQATSRELPSVISLPTTITDPKIKQMTLTAANLGMANELLSDAVTTPLNDNEDLLSGMQYISDPSILAQTKQAMAMTLSGDFVSDLYIQQPDNLPALESELQGLLGQDSTAYNNDIAQLVALTSLQQDSEHKIVYGQDFTADQHQLLAASNSASNAAQQADSLIDGHYSQLVNQIDLASPDFQAPPVGP